MRLCLWQDSLLAARGSTLRYSSCFLSEKWAAILLDASQIVIVVSKQKVLQRNFLEAILILFRRTGRSHTSNAKGPCLDLAPEGPERSSQPRGAEELRAVFQVSWQETAISGGAGRKSWLGSTS